MDSRQEKCKKLVERIEKSRSSNLLVSIEIQMQDWILTMLEKENASVEQRRRLLDALPSMGGMEKEAFFRIMTSI